jgi:hypothetical protein
MHFAFIDPNGIAHIGALFEPVNKSNDYFLFESCFINSSSKGHLSYLADPRHPQLQADTMWALWLTTKF